MAVSVAYIAASANRFGHAADISPTSLVAFGSSRLIALWQLDDEYDSGVSETLDGHEGLVTGIRFLSSETFVSADDKGILMHWRKYRSQWKSTGKVHAHANAISSLCTFKNYVVSGASDSLVKIWRVVHKDDTDDFTIDQVLALQGRYALSLALSILPKTDVFVLATAGTDTSVQLWLRSGEIFTHSSTLAGHEDWIRSLAFKSPDEEDAPLVLASGSQDATIRLWNIEPWRREMTTKSQQPSSVDDELLDTFEAALGDVGDTEEGTRQISLKRHILTIKSEQSSTQQFSVTFDALLVGHEAGVTSLSWRPSSLSNRTSTLLSTSTDSSLILWSPSTFFSHSHGGGTSIWVNRQRFGDIGGQRLGGFIGGSWTSGGRDALAWGWAGGWRRWRCANSDEESNESWTELGAISGHSGPVKGLDWSPGGEYIISAGVDQTTRIHGAIPTNAPVSLSWHELSRPQVHGYDLLNVSFVDSLRFVSIADEKVARVFEAPQGFVDLIQTLQIADIVERTRIRPVAASVPPLGLSNKASAAENNYAGSIAEKPTRRPFEGELALSTLWPEVEKIFGHGYESITLGVSNSRRFIATACKATSPEHAVIRVYDTTSYKQIGQPLQGHTLSVTRIAFSPDDKLVLSVSRDRSWRLFGLQESGEYLPIAADKSHGRIIWDCAWASEGDIFATASRDKTVKIWGLQDQGKWVTVHTIKTEAPATAVAFSNPDLERRRRLAIGLETGEILVYNGISSSTFDWKQDAVIPRGKAHIDHIHRLSWRQASNAGELASCSEDGTLKVLIVQLATD